MITKAILGPPGATLDDLMRTEGKAELIGGRVVESMATGRWPGKLAARILRSLEDYERIRGGDAYGDNVGYAVDQLRSGRESFSPDASYFAGPHTGGPMDFVDGPPTFAVEVRSKGDYGPAAEDQMERKREDYFEAGTKAVWDVDPLAETATLYLADEPQNAVIFRAGDTAHAEPAVPGWTLAVDELFSR